MIRQDTLSEAPEDLQPDLAGGHKNWLRKVIAESTQAKVGLIVLGIGRASCRERVLCVV